MITPLGHLARFTCILLLATLPLAATTTNLIGVVVSVEAKKGEHQGKSFVYHEAMVRIRWGQINSEDNIQKWKIYHGTFFLDGQRSTVEQALQPGHLVKLMGDIDYYACYSDDFRFKETIPNSFGPDRGVYRLHLPGGAGSHYRVGSHKDRQKNEMKQEWLGMDLFLHLLCRDGAVVAVGASQNARKDWVRVYSLPVDASGLRIEDGRLQGPVTVTLLSHGDFDLPQESGTLEKRFIIDAPLGQATSKGGFTYNEKQGTLTITGTPEPILADNRAVIIQSTGGTGSNYGPLWPKQELSIDARFEANALTDWYLSTSPKFGPSHSTIQHYDLQWDEGRFSGTIVLSNPDKVRHNPSGTLHIEGVVIGDQLFGSTRSEFEGNHGKLPGRLRGWILRPEAPPIIGWDEGMAKRWIKANKGSEKPMPDILLKKK